MRKILVSIIGGALAVIGSLLGLTTAYALQSTNYRFTESALGGIGNDKSQSASYQALTSGGIIGFGNSVGGADTQINSGNSTTSDPTLSFAVASSGITFPDFSPTQASTTTSTFAVSNYTSYGYVVQILGAPPSNGNHTISAMSTTDVSQVGTEQYGINLVANTSPTSVGQNPDHGDFGFGDPTPNYATTNNYRYVSGETIASSPKSSGTTIYTISYLINVSSITPGGKYSGGQTIICTATF